MTTTENDASAGEIIGRAMGHLHPPGQVVELRAPNAAVGGRGFTPTLSGYFDDAEKMMGCAAGITAPGVYFTLNPVDPRLLARRNNRLDVMGKKDASTGDKDIAARRWLFVEVDPDRPSGICASDSEKAGAAAVANAVAEHLQNAGWPEAMVIDSGNGVYLLYRIDLPADDGGMVKRCLTELARRFDTPAAHVDTTVFNPARIVRLPGTMNRKGDGTPDRPHRRCVPVAVPDVMRVVPTPLIEALASSAPAEPEKVKRPQPAGRPHSATADYNPSDTPGEFNHRLLVPRYLAERGVEVLSTKSGEQGQDRWRITCPFDPSHTGTDAYVFQYPLGQVGFHCSHNSCGRNRWQEFKEKVGRPLDDHYEPPLLRNGFKSSFKANGQTFGTGGGKPPPSSGKAAADQGPTAPTVGGNSNEHGDVSSPSNETPPPDRADDPNRLAAGFLGSLTPHTFRFWRGQFHQYDTGAYAVVPDDEVRGRVWAWVRAEFLRINAEEVAAWRAVGDSRAEMPMVRKVSTRLIGDVTNALRSVASLPGCVHPPAWVDGATGPDPLDVLACRNGLIDLTTGRLSDPDPRFFTLNAVAFDYRDDAPRPAEWEKFLLSLWGAAADSPATDFDADSLNAIQEWFGYLLTCDTSLQKMLAVIGPRRSGKGTILRVLGQLVGARNYAGTTLGSLADRFGLAPLLDKSVAVFSDARLSGRADTALIVERILSITGEDVQGVDRKHLGTMQAKLNTRFVFVSNELPKLTDSSGALTGRMILLRLTRSFFGKEDTRLADRLSTELPGILLWAIDGLRRLRERGRFVQPVSGRDLLCDMEELASPVGAFVADRCIIDPSGTTPVKDMFGEWERWCKDNARDHTGTSQSFSRDLHAVVPTLATRRVGPRSARARVYHGIRVGQEDLPA